MRARDRRPKWRAAILEPRTGMTDSCRVLLLKLSLAKEMQPNGRVSSLVHGWPKSWALRRPGSASGSSSRDSSDSSTSSGVHGPT